MTEDEAKPDLLRSAMESAKETIKACLIINAGSAAALIAFMGHLVTQKEYKLVEQLAPSTTWFVVGVLAAIVGHGLSYLSNLFFVFWPITQRPRHQIRGWFRYIVLDDLFYGGRVHC
jgi:hypothetical protein